MRSLALFLIALCIVCCGDQQAQAAKRVALVIGNSAYRNVTPLTNPVNDAAAIADLFKKASFDVVGLRDDLTNAEMRRALRDFSDKTRDADIAVIYYAGHGIEVDGTNYLIPVDAAIERDTDAYDEAIALERILQAVEPARQLRLIILDACRDNPFAKKMKRTLASRALGRGLAGVEPNQPNTLIAFAAKGGSTALDGDSKNSPFTGALLKHLTTPGLEVRKAFGLVRDDVMAATGNKQEPFVYGSLGGNDVALVAAPAAPRGKATADVRQDYELAEKVGTREAWDSFVAAYPAGFYSDLAKAQRNKLAAEAARIAATEKARAAADEQARLVAEGAKASEQAKANERTKAAEQARLAAEKQKQSEEAAVAAAERAKETAQSKATSEQPPPPVNQQDAGKASAQTLAALPPADSAARQAGQTSDADTPRLLQTELKRVGCWAGAIDGVWGESSQRALTSFNRHAGTKLDVKLASADALDAVRSKSGRVCPLACERGYRAVGDTCVATACKPGFERDDEGACRRIERRGHAQPAARDAAPRVQREAAPIRPQRAPTVARQSGQVICDDHGCRPVSRGCRASDTTGPFQSEVCN
jgi:uncharacterized caspase-like protein